MAAPTFPFHKLPLELRQQIWAMAIRPPGRGVHRLSLSGSPRKSPIFCYVDTDEPDRDSFDRIAMPKPPDGPLEFLWTRDSPSTYLWDAGLWTACKESREIIMAHFRVQHWNSVRAQLLSTNRLRLTHWDSEDVAHEYPKMTAMTIARHNGEEWHLMVQPHQDLFIVDPLDVLPAVDFDWQSFITNLPFCSWATGYGGLCHIAVEFDKSWNVGIDSGIAYDVLLEEPTARGFVARAIAACLDNELVSFIWLIDRGFCEVEMKHSWGIGPVVFRDSKHTYVGTNAKAPWDMKWRSKDTDYESTALWFVHLLDEWSYEAYLYSQMASRHRESEDYCRPSTHVGVLACV